MDRLIYWVLLVLVVVAVYWFAYWHGRFDELRDRREKLERDIQNAIEKP